MVLFSKALSTVKNKSQLKKKFDKKIYKFIIMTGLKGPVYREEEGGEEVSERGKNLFLLTKLISFFM